MTEDHWKARAASGSILISSYIFLLLLEGSCLGQSSNNNDGGNNGQNFFYYYSPNQRAQVSHGLGGGQYFDAPFYTQHGQQQGQAQEQGQAPTTPQSSHPHLLGFHQTTQASPIFTQAPLGHFSFGQRTQPQNPQQNPQDDQQLPEPSSSFTTFTRFGHDLFANRGLLPVSTPQQSYYAASPSQNPPSFYESPYQFLQQRYLQNLQNNHNGFQQFVSTLSPAVPTQSAALAAPSTTMTPPPPIQNADVMLNGNSVVVTAAPQKRRRQKQKISSRFRYVQVPPTIQQYNPYSQVNPAAYTDIPYVEHRFYNDAVPSAPTPTGYSYSLGEEGGTSRSSVHVSMGPSANIQQHLTEITATRNRILQRQRQQQSVTTVTPTLDTRPVIRNRASQNAPVIVSTEAPVTEASSPTSTAAPQTSTTEASQEPQPSSTIPQSPIVPEASSTPEPLPLHIQPIEPQQPSSTEAVNSAIAPIPEEPQQSPVAPEQELPELNAGASPSVGSQNVSQNTNNLEPLLKEPSFQTETIADPISESLQEEANPSDDPEVAKKINDVNIPKRLVIRKKVARKRLRLDSVEVAQKDPEAAENLPSPSPIPIRRRISPNRIPQETKTRKESPAAILRSQLIRTTTSPPTSTTTTTTLPSSTTEAPQQSDLTQDYQDETYQEQPLLSSTTQSPAPSSTPIPAIPSQDSEEDYEEYDEVEPQQQPIEPITTPATTTTTTTTVAPPMPVEEKKAADPTVELPSPRLVGPGQANAEADEEYYDEDEYDADPIKPVQENTLGTSSVSAESGELPTLKFVHKEDYPGVFKNHSGTEGDTNSVETDQGQIITRYKTSRPSQEEIPVSTSTTTTTTTTTTTEEPSNLESFVRQDPPEEMSPEEVDKIEEPVFQPRTTEAIPVVTPSAPTPESKEQSDEIERSSDEASLEEDDKGSVELEDQAPLMPPATESQSQNISETEPIFSTTSPSVEDCSGEVSIEDRREQVLVMEGQVSTDSSLSSSTSTTEQSLAKDEIHEENNQLVKDEHEVEPQEPHSPVVIENDVSIASSTESQSDLMAIVNGSSTTEVSVISHGEEEVKDPSVSSTEGSSPVESSTAGSSDDDSAVGSSTTSSSLNSTLTTEAPHTRSEEDFSSYSQELPFESQEEHDGLTQSEEDKLSSDEEVGKAQRLALEETLRRLRERKQQQTDDPSQNSTETPAAPPTGDATSTLPSVQGGGGRGRGRPFMRRRLQLANLPLPTSGPVPNINAVLGDDHVDRSQVIEKIQRFRSNFRRVSTTTKRPRRVTRPSTERPDELDEVDSFSESSSLGMNDPIPATTTTTSTTTTTPRTTSTTIPPYYSEESEEFTYSTTSTTTTTSSPFSPMTTTPPTDPIYTTMISSTETVTFNEPEPMTTHRTRYTSSTTTTSPRDLEEEEFMTTTIPPRRAPIPVTRTTTTTTTPSPPPQTTMTPDFYEKDEFKDNSDDDVYYSEEGSSEVGNTSGSSTETTSTTTSTTTEVPSSSTEVIFQNDVPSSYSTSTTLPPDTITTVEPYTMATTSTSTTLPPEVTTTTEAIGQLIIHEILPTMPPIKEVSFVIGDSVEEEHSGSLEEPKSDEHLVNNHNNSDPQPPQLPPNIETKAIVRVETKVEVSSSADSTNDSSGELLLTHPDSPSSQQVSSEGNGSSSSSDENGEKAEVSTTSMENGRKVRVVIKRQKKVSTSTSPVNSNTNSTSSQGGGRRRRRKVLHNQRRRRPSRIPRRTTTPAY